jgi:hypothetical protein
MATKFYYDESKDPDGAQHIYGVPKADMTDEQFEALPKWLQAQVDASPRYRKTAPTAAKQAAAGAEAEIATQEPAGETEKPAEAGEG